MKKPHAVTVINFVVRGFVITVFGPGTMNILKIINFFSFHGFLSCVVTPGKRQSLDKTEKLLKIN